MTKEIRSSVIPLVNLNNLSTPLLYNNENFNSADLLKAPSHLQSSIKKSVNFKDKIPIKKDIHNEELKIRTKKFEYSEDLEDVDQEKRES